MVMAPILGSCAGRPLQELLPDLAASLSVLYPIPGQGQTERQRKRPNRPMDPREKAAKQAEAVQEQLRLQCEKISGPSGSKESVRKLAKAKAEAHPKKGAEKEGMTEGAKPVVNTVALRKCKQAEIEPKEKASQAKRKVRDVKMPSMEGVEGMGVLSTQSMCSQSPSGKKSMKRSSNTQQSEKMKSQKAQKDHKDHKDQKDLAKLPKSREAKTKLKVQESQTQKAKKLKTGEELKEIGFPSAPSEKSSEALRDAARPIQSIRRMEMNVVPPASQFPMASELTIFMQNLAVRKNLRA